MPSTKGGDRHDSKRKPLIAGSRPGRSTPPNRTVLPPLTEALRHEVCVRVLDAIAAHDEGRSDDMDTHLRWVEVLCFLWGGTDRLDPLMPDVNRIRASDGVEPL